MFNGAKLRIKNEKTTIIKEKISICSRINKKSKRIDRFFDKPSLITLFAKVEYI